MFWLIIVEVLFSLFSAYTSLNDFKSYSLVFDCRYYDLDAYHRHQLEKEMKKGLKKVISKERTVFNDEEQRRYVLPLQAR